MKTHELVEEYVKLSDDIDTLFFKAEELDKKRQQIIESIELSVNKTLLRPMTADDVKVGQIVISEGGENGYFACEIREVLNPSSDFKAFVATDGCRYGLYGAFILI